jgi:hypothetical protein
MHAWVLLHCTARQQQYGAAYIGQLTKSTELMVPVSCIACMHWELFVLVCSTL